MNVLLSFLFFSLMAVSSGLQCQKKSVGTNCYKGRLEVKGICMNYTIKVLEGNIDTAFIASIWKDESTGITHENVFKLESVCDFPNSIKQGDEFYFTINQSPKPADCMVCLAFYPTPLKGLSIQVLEKGCN